MLFVGVRESRSQPINLVVCHDGDLGLYSAVAKVVAAFLMGSVFSSILASTSKAAMARSSL